MFAGNFAPVSWNFCDGSLLSISEYDALYSLIGNIYGGDGQNTFAVPDLRGRLPVGQGAGPGLTPRTLGQQFGVDVVTLTPQQMPAHSHNFVATTGAASGPNPENALFANTGGDNLYVPNPANPQLKAMGQQTVMNAGMSQAHNNIMSSLAMNYIICLEGIYPPQS